MGTSLVFKLETLVREESHSAPYPILYVCRVPIRLTCTQWLGTAPSTRRGPRRWSPPPPSRSARAARLLARTPAPARGRHAALVTRRARGEIRTQPDPNRRGSREDRPKPPPAPFHASRAQGRSHRGKGARGGARPQKPPLRLHGRPWFPPSNSLKK